MEKFGDLKNFILLRYKKEKRKKNESKQQMLKQLPCCLGVLLVSAQLVLQTWEAFKSIKNILLTWQKMLEQIKQVPQM